MSNTSNNQSFVSVLVGKKVLSIDGYGIISGISGYIINYEDGYKTVCGGGGGCSGEDVMWCYVLDSTDRVVEEY